MAVKAVRGLVTFFCVAILFIAFMLFMDEVTGDPVFPKLSFINNNSILAAIVVLVLINVAASQTIKAEKNK
jgi:hypothetical protein